MKKENLKINNNDINEFVKKAKVFEKVYKDKGIYVTICSPINGEKGLNNLIEDTKNKEK